LLVLHTRIRIRASSGAPLEMKAHSPVSCRLSTGYHRPKNIGGRSSAIPSRGSRTSPLGSHIRIRTVKVFDQKSPIEYFLKSKANELRSRRGLSSSSRRL